MREPEEKPQSWAASLRAKHSDLLTINHIPLGGRTGGRRRLSREKWEVGGELWGRGEEAICYLICSRLKSQAEDFHLLRSLFLLLFLLSVFMWLFFPRTAGTNSPLVFSSSGSTHCHTPCTDGEKHTRTHDQFWLRLRLSGKPNPTQSL